MENKKAAHIKVKVDLHKYNDQLHIYRLRSEDKVRTTRYVFDNVSSEDLEFAMSGFITAIFISNTEDSREFLYPHWAKSFKSKYMSADVATWTLSQARIQGTLHNERAILRHQYDPGFMRRDYEFVEMIEREDTTMNELVGAFTQQLYRMPPLLKGTIYKMD